MSEANSASRVCEQSLGGSSEGRMRKLHKRKSSGQSRVMEGIIMKITETTISETEKNQPAVRPLSASETEGGAFIHPTSGVRRQRRKKIKSMDTTEITCDSTNKMSRHSLRKEKKRKTKKIKTSKPEKSASEESEGDTGGEGDDEMTDYCSGPEATTAVTTTKPEFKVINWWDTEGTEGNEDEELNTILRGVMSLTSSANLHVKPQTSSASSKSLRNRLGKFGISSTRSQRRGRRRNKNNPHHQNNGGEQLRGSQDRLKRRKATSDEDALFGSKETPIPATNIGYRMLTGMGWQPGSGLTKDSIREPIVARGRRKRSAGLGL